MRLPLTEIAAWSGTLVSHRVPPTGFSPGVVVPLVLAGVPDDGGGFRRRFAIEGVGVGLELLITGEAGSDVVLVGGSLAERRDEDFPNAAVAVAHGMAAGIPVVEFAGEGDGFGIRGPDGEADAADAFGFDDVSAQSAPGFEERALGVEVEIGVGELRAEAIGVVDFDFAAVKEARANKVRHGVAIERGHEETARVLLDRGGALGADHYFDGFGLGEKRADFPAGLAAFAADAVRAQDAKGVAMVAANDGFNFFHCHESLIKYGRFPAAIA